MENKDFDMLFPCVRENEVGIVKFGSLENYFPIGNIKKRLDNFDIQTLKQQFIKETDLFLSNLFKIISPVLSIPLFNREEVINSKIKNNYTSNHNIFSYLHNNVINEILNKKSSTKLIHKIKNRRDISSQSTKNKFSICKVSSDGFYTKERIVNVPTSYSGIKTVNVPITVLDYIPTTLTNIILNYISSKLNFAKNDYFKKIINTYSNNVIKINESTSKISDYITISNVEIHENQLFTILDSDHDLFELTDKELLKLLEVN